jgi:hypothetical protein
MADVKNEQIGHGLTGEEGKPSDTATETEVEEIPTATKPTSAPEAATSEPDGIQDADEPNSTLGGVDNSTSVEVAARTGVVASSANEAAGDSKQDESLQRRVKEETNSPDGTTNPSQENQRSPENKKGSALRNPSRRTVLAIAAVVVGGLIIGSIAKREHDHQQEIVAHDAYIDNLTSVSQSMLGGAAEAETTCNLIYKVWHAAIWESNRYSWDQDIRDYYSTDFNTALKKLMSSSEYSKHVSTIKSYNDSVEASMKQLSDPPKDCGEAYDTLEELYHQYTTLTSLATDPSGSFNSFSSDFSNSDSDFMTAYRLLQTQIPEKQGS